MKIIKSKSYMKKEAILSLPVGDPGLPEQLTEKDIPPTIDEDIVKNLQGESEIEVNWLNFAKWYSAAGEPLPDVFLNRTSPSFINLSYTYSYNYNENFAEDIKPIQMKDYKTNKIFTDLYLIESFIEYYSESIKEDIEILEEQVKNERQSDYIPF